MKKTLSVLLLLTLLLMLLSSCAVRQPPPDLASYTVGQSLTSNASTVSVNSGPAAVKDEEITQEEYALLVEGETTYEQACEIIGAEGRAMKERGGITPYQWVGYTPMSKSVEMNFRDGVLVSKDPKGSNIAAKKGS